MKQISKKSVFSTVVYAILLAALLVTMVLTLGAAFSADFARAFERFMIRDLGWFDFDMFSMGQWVLIGLTVITVGFLVLGDELQIRRSRKVHR